MHFSRDNLIVMGILAVITVTYFAVVYRAQSAQIEDVGARTAEIKRRIEDDAVNASRVPPMLRKIEGMKRRYNKEWDQRLPRQQELAGFLREISSGLSQAKLTNQFIQPGDPFRRPLYNCLPIILKFEGNFLAMAGFIKRVDEIIRLTRIEHLKIESNEETGNLSIELGLNIYFTEK